MVIAGVLDLLENSNHPVAHALHKDSHFKVLVIAFKKGMSLDKHSSKFPSKITVLDGKVVFKSIEASITLNKYADLAIPVLEPHWFEALEDSLCLLTQAWDESIVHTPAHNIWGWDY
jgi:quercetin dioxygenase-like cupin family protein